MCSGLIGDGLDRRFLMTADAVTGVFDVFDQVGFVHHPCRHGSGGVSQLQHGEVHSLDRCRSGDRIAAEPFLLLRLPGTAPFLPFGRRQHAGALRLRCRCRCGRRKPNSAQAGRRSCVRSPCRWRGIGSTVSRAHDPTAHTSTRATTAPVVAEMMAPRVSTQPGPEIVWPAARLPPHQRQPAPRMSSKVEPGRVEGAVEGADVHHPVVRELLSSSQVCGAMPSTNRLGSKVGTDTSASAAMPGPIATRAARCRSPFRHFPRSETDRPGCCPASPAPQRPPPARRNRPRHSSAGAQSPVRSSFESGLPPVVSAAVVGGNPRFPRCVRGRGR